MRVRTMQLLLCGLLFHFLGAAGLAVGSELAAGTYRCSAYNVSGGGGSCRNMQPLILDADGTYQHSSTRGRWSAEGGQLRLSESTLWGAGQVLGRDTVRFEYDYRGWHHTVTWVCQECASSSGSAPGPAPTGPPASRGAFVGATLTIQFDSAVGGVSTYTIVPAASAQAYGHNAPLPDGAVQGVAWEASATSVSLATNRNNKLASGRRYVVFLSWPRETIPVAILDLPPGTNDYTATLAGTLDGSRVLREAGLSGGHDGAAAPTEQAPDPQEAAGGAAPWMLGIQLEELTPAQAQYLGMREPAGALVANVVPGGAAQSAGVLAGDVITHVNGMAVTGAPDVQRLTQSRRQGQATRLGLIRMGDNMARIEIEVPAGGGLSSSASPAADTPAEAPVEAFINAFDSLLKAVGK